jgi:hypothetical protein
VVAIIEIEYNLVQEHFTKVFKALLTSPEKKVGNPDD